MTSPIPAFYRIFFNTIDPALCLMGMYGNTLNPAFILESFMPKFTFPPAVETQLVLDGQAGFFAGLAMLQIGLLRAKPNDVTVWRYLQANVLLVDLFQLVGFFRAFVDSGRTDIGAWRGSDWGNVVGYSALIALRAAFLLGVGMRKPGKASKEL